MELGASVTLWFGKEIGLEDVRKEARHLKEMGFEVRSPFYIGYNLSNDMVLNYLKCSLNASDYLYVLGTTGKLLEEIEDYAREVHKPIVRKEMLVEC